jgi:hypothetical protein
VALAEGKHALGGKHIKAKCAACAEFGKADLKKGGDAPIQYLGKRLALSKRYYAVPRKAANGHFSPSLRFSIYSIPQNGGLWKGKADLFLYAPQFPPMPRRSRPFLPRNAAKRCRFGICARICAFFLFLAVTLCAFSRPPRW